MVKISLAGFKDPVRRPRFIIWAGVAVLMIAAVMIPVLGVTSTRWFCTEGCHKVQDDSITAYQHSSHANVSCMACHMPANANPVVFILHKAEALGELYMTVTDNYELPLNGESEVGLTMASTQCTQCHSMETRIFTPSPGIKIDHEAHSEVNAACTVCHNRVGHREDFELALKNPEKQGGEPNTKHADFMSMTACFRCHSLEADAAAPGACSRCHSADFNLKPPSHSEAGFYPKGHAEMAKEMKVEADEAKAEHEKKLAEEGRAEGDDVAEVIAAQRSADSEDHESIGEELPTVESVFYCSTCHTEKFCTDCHGMEMPHPAEFAEPKDAKDAKGHPVLSKDKNLAKKCVMCHGENEKTKFCDECHHGTYVDYEFDAKSAWTTAQHPKAVAKSGVKACTTKCHSAKFCVDCHTGRNVVPTSHRKSGWTRPKKPTATKYGASPAEPSATHALDAQKSMESCAVCHGSGGTEAKFCKACHKLEMPHPAQFKEFHAKSNRRQCVLCHSWNELCSNCHHVGASFSKSWIGVHGSSVNKNGAAGCSEKCHTKNDCVKCHQARRVLPASHRAGKFVRDFSSKQATHVQLYNKDGEICTYCHRGAAAELPAANFCNGCHKLTMPHPDGFGAKGKGNGGEHKELFSTKKTTKKVCANCHKTAFCNSCHHEGAPASRPWVRYHPTVVKKDGAAGCFDCHEEVYCSNCHVNLAKRGLLN